VCDQLLLEGAQLERLVATSIQGLVAERDALQAWVTALVDEQAIFIEHIEERERNLVQTEARCDAARAERDALQARVEMLTAALDKTERHATTQHAADMQALSISEARVYALEQHAIAQGGRVAELEAALREIKERPNQVCAEFEICQHVGCQSSYLAFAIADAALAPARAGGV